MTIDVQMCDALSENEGMFTLQDRSFKRTKNTTQREAAHATRHQGVLPAHECNNTTNRYTFTKHDQSQTDHATPSLELGAKSWLVHSRGVCGHPDNNASQPLPKTLRQTSKSLAQRVQAQAGHTQAKKTYLNAGAIRECRPHGGYFCELSSHL